MHRVDTDSHLLEPDPTSPILLTGLPRCGSSWVGQRLSDQPGLRYRYESLNADWVPALKGQLGPFRYQPPDSPGPERLRAAADFAFSGRQSLRQRLRAIYRGYGATAFRGAGRLVLKDPTACLLAGWLEQRHRCRVVVLTRHPCGFVHSVQRLGWPMRLQRLLSQRSLVRDHLSAHEDLLRSCLQDPLAALGGFWAATHLALRRQGAGRWSFISYEQLCLFPAAGFRNLSGIVGTPIASTADARHRDDPGSTLKDGRRVALAWQAALSRQEIDRIMQPVDALDLREFAEAGLAQETS